MAKKLLSHTLIEVLYDEPDTDTYRGVVCKAGFHREPFNSGDVSKDYRDAVDYAKGLSEHVSNTSSVDHFIMDGPFAYVDGTIRRLENEPRTSQVGEQSAQ
jgi:hypothetical protein